MRLYAIAEYVALLHSTIHWSFFYKFQLVTFSHASAKVHDKHKISQPSNGRGCEEEIGTVPKRGVIGGGLARHGWMNRTDSRIVPTSFRSAWLGVTRRLLVTARSSALYVKGYI